MSLNMSDIKHWTSEVLQVACTTHLKIISHNKTFPVASWFFFFQSAGSAGQGAMTGLRVSEVFTEHSSLLCVLFCIIKSRPQKKNFQRGCCNDHFDHVMCWGRLINLSRKSNIKIMIQFLGPLPTLIIYVISQVFTSSMFHQLPFSWQHFITLILLSCVLKTS